MEKRAFLKILGVGSVAAILDGCANTSELERMVSGDAAHTSNPLPMTTEDLVASAQARKIFESIRQTGYVPTLETQKLRAAIDNWNGVSLRFAYTQSIAIEDAAPLAQALAPALRLSFANSARNQRK